MTDVVVVAQKAVSKVEAESSISLTSSLPRGRGSSPPTTIPVGSRSSCARAARSFARVRRSSSQRHHGFVCASAGVDASNAKGSRTPWCSPADPDASAEHLRSRILELTGLDVGVIVSDSFGRAWRRGTTDVALGVSGIVALRDLRGQRDTMGYELHATEIAVGRRDRGRGELVMGKTDGIPAAIVRGPRGRRRGRGSDLLMPRERDLFR